MYQIKTEQFEGPISLLLELIEKRELDITRLSLAKVTDDFLFFLEEKENINLVNLTEFIAVASQLILIKSKALLPLFEITSEEEEELEDLEERLKEYRRFKEIAMQLEKMFDQKKVAFSKKEDKLIKGAFVDPRLKPLDLKNSLEKFFQAHQPEEKLEEKRMAKVISLEEKMVDLKSLLESRVKFAFHEAVAKKGGKVEVLVTFLAVLEMVKRRTILVSQETVFGEISLERKSS